MSFSDKFGDNYDPVELKYRLIESINVINDSFLPVVKELESSEVYNMTYNFHYSDLQNYEKDRKNLGDLWQEIEGFAGFNNPKNASSKFIETLENIRSYIGACVEHINSLSNDVPLQQAKSAAYFIRQFSEAKDTLLEERQSLLNYGCSKRLILGGYYDKRLDHGRF